MTAEVILMTLVGLVLTGLPLVAAALVAVRLGVRSVPLILCLALTASGAAAMLTFWVYFAPPSVGATGAYLVLFGSIAAGAWALPGAARERVLLRRLAVPLGLWLAATFFAVTFGFMFGGSEQATVTSGLRFATDPSPFATDNVIPLFNADWLFAGHPGSPPVFPGEWQFGDRPPLQSGYVLSNRVFDTGMGELRYELLGIALQQLWIIGMWALLLAARVAVRTRALVVAATLVCDAVILSSFYVWPKLIGAAFLLAALALLVSPGQPLLRSRPWTVLLLGALGGIAMLAHGSNAFALLAIVPVALWRGLPDWRWVAAGVGVALLLFLPWKGFQSYADPPSNRLVKWSLAGSPAVDDRGVLEAMVDEYRAAGLAQTLDNKYRNYLTMLGGNPASGSPPEGSFGFGDVPTEIDDALAALRDGRLSDVVSKVREIRQWHLFWMLGLLPLGLLAILVGRLRGAWRDDAEWWLARFCLVFTGIWLVVFGLLMFGNVAGRALPGSGSFAPPLMMMVGIVAGLAATYPRLATWFVGANVLTTLALYVPFISDAPGFAFAPITAIAAVACLAAAWVISLSEP